MSFFTHVSPSVRKRLEKSSATIIAAAYYALFLLPMQYSKHSWAISHLDRTWDSLAYLHAELSLLLMTTAFLVILVPSLVASVSALSAYYYLSLMDFIIWHTVSRPFHPADIMRVVDLAIYFPAFASLSREMIAGAVLFVAAPVPVLLVLLRIWQKAARTHEALQGCLAYGCAAFLALYALAFPLVGFPGYFQRNSLVRMVHEMVYERDLKRMPAHAGELGGFFGQPVREDGAGGKQVSHGKKDIILFIMETTPYEYYLDEVDRFVRGLPWRYPGHTVSLREHYTTYPESDRAVLSILTGRYPVLERGSKWSRACDFSDALPKVLKASGYRTYLLSTAPLDFQDDRSMMEGLGFDAILERPGSGGPGARGKGGRPDSGSLYRADQDMVRDALGIVSSGLAGNYLLVLLPQASHSPFQAPPGYSGDGSQGSLIRANARWQLGLIEEIMERVAEKGLADRTCFIITGDHGLRHPAESSLFDELDWLSPLTFQVPLVLCSPDGTPRAGDSATSHIDITPTILEMNGLRYDGRRYHGRSMFGSARRTVFFLGGDYLPVNGFKQDGRFYMENRSRGIVLECPSMEFREAVQRRGIKTLMCGEVERVRVSGGLNILKGSLFPARTPMGR